MTESSWKEIIWGQFGAAIDALENAMQACPDELWDDRTQRAEFWYVTFHTLFWLDYYLSEAPDDFKPPEPFGLEEIDPAGVIPERPYTKDELQRYLEHGRSKGREAIAAMTEARASKTLKLRQVELCFPELLLYIMRHVQHHAAQLNFILREQTDSAPGWTFTARQALRRE